MSYTHKNFTYNSNIIPLSGSNPLFGGPPEFYIPLRFWFCRNPGLALPLIALQSHDVQLYITFSGLLDIINPVSTGLFYNSPVIPYYDGNINVYADYIFLDSTERKQFATNNHEYLIEQVQYKQNVGATIDITKFTHPIKEIIITGSPLGYPFYQTLVGNAGPATSAPISALPGLTTVSQDNSSVIFNVNVSLNSSLSKTLNFNYYMYSRYYNWKHHRGCGSTAGSDYIMSIPFSLQPEESHPSGTCNFTRISSAFIHFIPITLSPSITLNSNLREDVYAVNYNIFRVTNGMGGLVFSS